MQTSQAATRQTLFAILSSAETDLRTCLREFVIRNPQGGDPYAPDLRDKLRARHKQLHGPDEHQPTDDELVEFLDFADTHELLTRHKALLPAPIAQDLMHLVSQFQPLAPVRNRVMHSRPLESDDFLRTYEFACEASKQRGLTWAQLTETMRRLDREPSYVLTLKLPEVLWDIPGTVPHNLPQPEFDDTGFIGRMKDRDDITKLILGHHQIVTILGEGGVGKTATLVKCLYDILDQASGQFDTIVWTSLKNQVLTAGGVKALRSSITSTLGLFQEIAKPLGASAPTTLTDAFAEIREYLDTFRVLLAIDNLETLQHDELREFLRDLPPKSKVVITSRIGLGELEIRRPLLQMNEQEAAQLFRRFAQVHNVASLMRLPQPDVIDMCRKLYCNPLVIRWFITSVQQGTPPTQLLTIGQREILEFCVRNVHERISEGARSLLQVVLAGRRPLGEAELAYLADMDAVAVRQHIYEIVGTMMVRAEQRKLSDGSMETQYTLTEISRKFLDQNHKPSRHRMQEIANKLTELSSTAEAAGMYREETPYDHRAIVVRSANDRVAALFLQKALRESRTKNLFGALALVDQAKEYAPTYAEVYKISAFIKVAADDYHGAQEDYEQALELAPDVPQVLFFYAGFRLRCLDDSAGALELVVKANALDPGNNNILALRARILTFLRRLEEAWEGFEEVLVSMKEMPDKFQLITTYMALDCVKRWIEKDNGQRQFGHAWAIGQKAIGLFVTAIERWPSDKGIRGTLCNFLCVTCSTVIGLHDVEAADSVVQCLAKYRNLLASCEDFHYLITWIGRMRDAVELRPETLEEVTRLAATMGVDLAEGVLAGTVLRVVADRGFGFIQSDTDGQEYFFHHTEIGSRVPWESVQTGSRFCFRLGSHNSCPCAVSLDPV